MRYALTAATSVAIGLAISNPASADTIVLDFDSTPSAWGFLQNHNLTISGVRISPFAAVDIQNYGPPDWGFIGGSVAMGWFEDELGGFQNPDYLGPPCSSDPYGGFRPCVYIDMFGKSFSFLSFAHGAEAVTVESSKGGMLFVPVTNGGNIDHIDLSGPQWQNIQWVVFNGLGFDQFVDDLTFSAANSYAATAYTMTTDLSAFDESAMSPGTGDTLGMLPPDSCNNRAAAIFRQNGDITVLGDAYPIVRGPDPSTATPECLLGQGHQNYPIRINSSGAVVGRSGGDPDNDFFLNPLPWIWTQADGFKELLDADGAGYFLNSDLSINDSGTVVGTQDIHGCYAVDVEYPFSGFVWTAADDAQTLTPLVKNLPPFSCIWMAHAINNLGQIGATAITGDRNHGDTGAPYAVVLIPTTGPAAFNDNYAEVAEGAAQTISVGANDIDFADPVAITITTQPTKGIITAISAPGPAAGITVTYLANTGDLGEDSFVYTMTDSASASDSATVTVYIYPAPPPPDSIPDPFSFIDQTGVLANTPITSNAIGVTGINVPTSISVVGGEYSISGAAFTALAGTLQGGSVRVRQTSSSIPGTATNATLMIGGVSDTFTVTVELDGDGVPDAQDNCVLATNGPLIPDGGGHSQLDADGDGYGNKCDPDLNNSGRVTVTDYTIMRNVLNQLPSSSPTAAAADLNGSGRVTVTDYTFLRNMLNLPPGPSALHPNCPPTCP